MQPPPILRAFFATQPLYGLGERDVPAQQGKTPRTREWTIFLVLALIIGAVYSFLIFNKALVELELETDTRTVLKIYWPNRAGNYSEGRTSLAQIMPEKTRYTFRTTDLVRLDHLRLDPSENSTAKISIRRIAVQQNGVPPWQLSNKKDFAALQVIAGVRSADRPEQGGLVLDIQADDPQLELTLPRLEKNLRWSEILGSLLVILLLTSGYFFFSRSVPECVPLLAAVILALILTMAVISAVNAHPDESVHISAAMYYEDHILPPRVGDPAIANTYSIYGVSRLHSGEIYYPLAGTFLRLLDPLRMDTHLTLRLFNVLLFLGLILYALRKQDFRFFLLPLLVSPQIWYIFSYVNSDSLALFTSLLAAYQLAAEDSAFNALLRDGPKKHRLAMVLILGLFLGILLMQKKNFYFSYLFLFSYFLWRLRVTRQNLKKAQVFQLLAMVLLGVSLLLAVRGGDAWVNDFRKKELLLDAREQFADYTYKPSTPVEKKHAYLQMRDKGSTLVTLFTQDHWGEKTFHSSFGSYGYTQYSGSFGFYYKARVAILLLLLVLAAALLRKGGGTGVSLLGIFTAHALLLVGAMLYKSWTVDFQPQGRYLIPLLPMFAVVCHHCRSIVDKAFFYSLILALFSLSVHSFIFVGLFEIGKALIP